MVPTRTEMLAEEFSLNNASPQAMQDSKLGTRLQKQKIHVMRLVYDATVDGLAQGTITMRNVDTGKAAKLPKGAIVRHGLIDVITAPTSGGSATISFSTGKTAADLKAATAIASITGIVALIPVGTAASAIKLTADVTPSIVIATADLLTGKFYVNVEYVLSEST